MFDEMERMLREIYEETQSIEDIRAARLTANPEHEDAIGMLIDGVFKLSEDIIEPMQPNAARKAQS